MKDAAPSEMATNLVQDHTIGDLVGSAPEFDHRIFPAQPPSVCVSHQHRGFSEPTGPFHLYAEHVRVAGRDRQDRTAGEDPGTRRVVQVSDRVPNDRPRRGCQYLHGLPNADGWMGAHPGQAWFVVSPRELLAGRGQFTQ